MPRLDGFETLECMRQNDAMKHVEVVMCTGSIYEKDRKRAESLGAIGYVLKPTLFAKLKPVLERAANTRLFHHEDDGYSLLRAS
jgi:CheY-like chemotaxis protein